MVGCGVLCIIVAVVYECIVKLSFLRWRLMLGGRVILVVVDTVGYLICVLLPRGALQRKIKTLTEMQKGVIF